jgi:tripartite-type tricarboxylate transporter receptor subunit TctC
MNSNEISRRAFVGGTAALVAGAGFAQQAFPSKPIRFLVPFPPGGSTTVVARLLAQKLGERLGQPVVVDNKPGANGLIASEELLKSPPDGHTILMVVNTHAINPVVMPSMPFDPVKDFTAVSSVYRLDLVLVAHPSVPANNLREFIALAKEKRGAVNFAAGDSAGLTHLAAENFNHQAGTKLQVIPYKGTAPALNDVLGGHVQAYFSSATPVIPHVKTGKLKAYAISGTARSPALPEVPTFAEAGLPGLDAGTWAGILVPAATPKAVVNKLAGEIAAIMNLPDVKEQLVAQGVASYPLGPEQFSALIKDDISRFDKLVKAANIKMDK